MLCYGQVLSARLLKEKQTIQNSIIKELCKVPKIILVLVTQESRLVFTYVHFNVSSHPEVCISFYVSFIWLYLFFKHKDTWGQNIADLSEAIFFSLFSSFLVHHPLTPSLLTKHYLFNRNIFHTTWFWQKLKNLHLYEVVYQI